MSVQFEVQSLDNVIHNLGNDNVNIEDNGEAFSQEKAHVLYSRGHLLEGVNYFGSLKSIAKLTRRTPQEVEEVLLIGQRKKLKSSYSLKEILALEAKFTKLGLDVYIESDSI